jgi:hypothetical protein
MRSGTMPSCVKGYLVRSLSRHILNAKSYQFNPSLGSMVLQKQEEALKNRVLKLAKRNYNSLGTFIRLVDYMVVETQVKINQESADIILAEMAKD